MYIDVDKARLQRKYNHRSNLSLVALTYIDINLCFTFDYNRLILTKIKVTWFFINIGQHLNYRNFR